MAVEYIPATADANVDALTDAVADVCEFFQSERAERGRVWERYNLLADERDGVRKLETDHFGELLAHAHEQGAVDVSIFGIAPGGGDGDE